MGKVKFTIFIYTKLKHQIRILRTEKRYLIAALQQTKTKSSAIAVTADRTAMPTVYLL